MKIFFLTVLFHFSVWSLIDCQEKKDSVEFYNQKVEYCRSKVVNDQMICDTICYRNQYITSSGFIYTDTMKHCESRVFEMYFPLKYTSQNNNITIDTSEFRTLYYGLKQFNEPKIWNTNQENSTIRIAIFKDTIPTIFRLEISDSIISIIKKEAIYGNWIEGIEKGYLETKNEIKPKDYLKLKRIVEDIFNKHFREYRSIVVPKFFVLETDFENNYNFIITDQLILSELKQTRNFNRLIKILNKKTTPNTWYKKLPA